MYAPELFVWREPFFILRIITWITQFRCHKVNLRFCYGFPGAKTFLGTFAGETSPWGPSLERPGNLTGPKSDFEIKISRKAGCVLNSNKVHFVSLANNLTVLHIQKFWNSHLEWKIKQRNGPGNYPEFRETGPWSEQDSTEQGCTHVSRICLLICVYIDF